MDEAVPGRPCGAYVDEELERWDAVGASPLPFRERLAAADRARLLRLAIGQSYGAAVARGLAWADAEAALSLAATRSVDGDQHEAKSLSLRDHAVSSDDLVGAMVRAALEHEAACLRSRDGCLCDRTTLAVTLG